MDRVRKMRLSISAYGKRFPLPLNMEALCTGTLRTAGLSELDTFIYLLTTPHNLQVTILNIAAESSGHMSSIWYANLMPRNCVGWYLFKGV